MFSFSESSHPLASLSQMFLSVSIHFWTISHGRGTFILQNWLENAKDKTDKSPAPRHYGSMALYIYLIKTNVTPGTMLQALEIWSLNETLA